MSSGEAAPPLPRASRWIFAWVAIGCLLRLLGLGLYSLWYDEGSSVAIAKAPDFLGALSFDRHPPLSYLALRLWIRLFGEDDAAMRALPALLSCAALMLFARWVRGWRGASAAVALFALAPFQIWHGQELRMYTFVELGALLALVGVERAATGLRASNFALVFGGTAIAVGSHYLGSLLAPALALAVWFRRRELSARGAWSIAAATFAGGLAWVPWIVSTLDRHTAQQWGRLGHHDLRALLEVPTRQILVGFGAIPNSLVWTVYASGALLALGWCGFFWRTMRRRDARDLALATLFVLPIAVAYGLDAVLRIGFLAKYVIVAAPAVTLAAAEGWSVLRPAALRWIVAGLGVAAPAVSTLVQRSENCFEDFRGTSRQLAESWQAGDHVLVLTGTPEPFNGGAVRHYLRERPEILAAMLPVERLEEFDRGAKAGERLHVIQRDHSDAIAPLARIETDFVLLRRDPWSVGIEHSLWTRRP